MTDIYWKTNLGQWDKRLGCVSCILSAIFGLLVLGFVFGLPDLHIASFDCGDDRFIHLYEPAFCDQSIDLYFTVEVDGDTVSNKYPTRLNYSCGVEIDSHDLHLVLDDDQKMAVIVHSSDTKFTPTDVILLCDFANNEYWPGYSNGYEIPVELIDNLDLTSTDE